MVHVFCTSSHGALHLCEVSCKISQMVEELWSGHKIVSADGRTLKILEGIT